MNDGYFDGSMPRSVLEYYLSRAATAAGLYQSDTLDDDIRVILRLGLKFLGRFTGIWKAETTDDVHFARTRAAAEKIHAADPEIILQACIFEAVYREDLERTPIPARVFEAFGLPAEDRCFNYDAVTLRGDVIPDISAVETQMWFYYRGIGYIDCGCEAFHMGQIHLYTARDRAHTAIGRVLSMLRAYGKDHARRHKVIFDAHSHSLVVNGVSLLDYNAMPFTRYPVLDRPGEKLVLVREGKSGGGISQEGVYEKALPFLYEYDNWGGRDNWAYENLTYGQRAWAQWWGNDQITWFATQDEASRNAFLEYTFKWTAINNPDGFFAFPLRRGVGGDALENNADQYRLNNRSAACPHGFSQEDAAAALLRDGYEKYRVFANPSDLLDFGGKDVDDPVTGVRLPEKVVLYGSFQPYVGAVENDSNSEITRMYYVGDGRYALSFILPYAGEYDFGISTWGTLSACVSENGGHPYSGSGGKSRFTVPADNTIIRITFTYMTNAIETEFLC